ncbi:MAG: RluA family pseudouridine synthase [Phycisphaerales bacterium]|nr:RluA family pseudouridine synthase [Phycisphaerales bacterium]
MYAHGYNILFADDCVVVCDKSSGLLSVPGIGPEKADCLIARVKQQFPDARIVHRLDMDTSGVLVLARNADAHRELSRQFEAREIVKFYLALVDGAPKQDEGVVDLPLRKQAQGSAIHIVDFELGKPSVTKWRVLERYPSERLGRATTLVELEPKTGRSHQLRVHLKAIGHPIVGDHFYSPNEVAMLSPRLMLHSARLEFTHPVSKERVSYAAAQPW